MYVAFDALPAQSRLWVYTANRPFSFEELQLIEKALPEFLQQWTAHGTGLQAGYTVLHAQFLLLAVDEATHAASGCSIDASVKFIKALEKELAISLTDRSLVPFFMDNKVQLVAMPALKEKLSSGEIHPDTLLFNTLLATKGELAENWQVAAGNSWLKRYFKGINA